MRDALLAADTVLAVWREPLEALLGADVAVDRSIALGTRLPAARLMPIALVAPERRLTVTPVCGARTLAEGRPPLGIACAQQDVARVYPLPDDPERCLEDFLELDRRARPRAGRAARPPGGLDPAASSSSATAEPGRGDRVVSPAVDFAELVAALDARSKDGRSALQLGTPGHETVALEAAGPLHAEDAGDGWAVFTLGDGVRMNLGAGRVRRGRELARRLGLAPLPQQRRRVLRRPGEPAGSRRRRPRRRLGSRRAPPLPPRADRRRGRRLPAICVVLARFLAVENRSATPSSACSGRGAR